jgi:hypothetical protein
VVRVARAILPLALLAGVLLGGLGGGLPAQASTTSISACAHLTSTLAKNILGGNAQQAANSSGSVCTYERSATKKHPIVLALILSRPTGSLRTRTLAKLQSLLNTTADGIRMYWYKTPPKDVGGERAGTLSVLKNRTLVLVAVRGVPNPEATAKRTMARLLPGF